MEITKDQIEQIRGDFEPVEGSKLATALDRCATALDDLEALQARATFYRKHGGRADSFLNRLLNYGVDLMTDDLLQTVKDAQATATAVSAIDAPMRNLLTQARDRYNNESYSLNNITRLLYERRRARQAAPGRYDAVLVKYCGHEPSPGGIVDRARRRLRTV